MWVGVHDGILWGLNSHDRVLIEIDLDTSVLTRWPVDHPFDGESFAVLGEDAIWFSTHIRFDLSTRETTSHDRTGGWPAVLANGGLWTIDAGEEPDSLIRFDASDPLKRFADAQTLSHDEVWGTGLIATPDGSIWISARESGTLTRIDTQTLEVAQTIDTGTGGDLLAYDGAIWIASENGTITRVANP